MSVRNCLTKAGLRVNLHLWLTPLNNVGMVPASGLDCRCASSPTGLAHQAAISFDSSHSCVFRFVAAANSLVLICGMSLQGVFIVR